MAISGRKISMKGLITMLIWIGGTQLIDRHWMYDHCSVDLIYSNDK